jgi:predicted naringenin-chalcone synthase
LDREAYIHAIASRVPEHSYTQEFALDFLMNIQGTTNRKREFLKKIYANTGIEKRHTVIGDYGKSPEDYTFYPGASLEPEVSTKDRNDVYIIESEKLSEQVSRDLFAKLPPGYDKKITHIITVSCTGMAAPGIDFHIMKSLGLSPTVNRYHVGFMGCYAAFPAMKLARNICLSEPDAKVLVVNLELCSLHLQLKWEPDIIVANAIFADGASAALVSSDPADSNGSSIVMKDFKSYIIPKSEKDMAWQIGKHGFDMKLSLYVPQLIDKNIKPVMKSLFESCGITRDEIDIWAVHPGGRAILEKVQNSLKIKKEQLSYSYDILRNFGNMSSVTIMFILQSILEDDSRGSIFSCAFGPGLTVESGYLVKQ